MNSDPEEGDSFTPVTQTSSHVNLSSQFLTVSMTELGNLGFVSPSKFAALPTLTPQPSPPAPVPTQPSTIPLSPTSPAGPAPRSRKRKQGSSACLNCELTAPDKRRTDAMEAGRQRRDAMLQLIDSCGRYVLHVADLMRTLPPEVLSDFKWKLQNLMHETEQKVALLSVNTVEL